ncbi:hypothetical protein CHU92_04585 [Flavobacterium cyanobacteriorum]|uniref:Secretion system C-terminal sorting domain-containing protein n=2 Tax=Flavobacterium cyanobacteriorum TaxID=2022802 RepID=A0A255ZDY6_9FLAO|nr:hypothetical protein CHU92_04585 [Flavobacterium cyanobacteriorum]
MYNGGSMYIHGGTSVYVSSGVYYFAPAGASTVTARGTGPGVLAFGPGVTTSGASPTHFVDGYAATYGTSAFDLPVGQAGILAPVRVASSASTETRAAYFYTSPSGIGAALSPGINAVSSVEYWHVVGNQPAFVSVSWRNTSDVSSLTGGNLNRLTIVGWDGSSWNEIPSTVDATSFTGGASTLTSGSISSNAAVNLSLYSYFSLGSKNPVCYTLATPSGLTRTWNGSWDGPVPTLSDAVVINAPYSGSLQCNSLVLNADLILSDGEVLDVVYGVTGSGKVVMSGEASLVQRDDSAAAPLIQLTKVTNPMRRLDYVFLSSPVNSMSVYMANLTSPLTTAVNGNFGTYPASAFFSYLTYNAAGNAYVAANATNVPIGKGLSATVASQAPYATSTAPGTWFTEMYPVHIRTTGTTNNGLVPVSVPANGWFFLGNPYPCAISGEKLLDAVGTTMRKTLYYWTHTTPRASWNNSGSNYNNADFATWNYSGGVAACAGCQVPNGKIASMQSVLMRSITPAATTLNLNNCLRELTGNDNFFRHVPSDRYWLNLTGSNGSFCQTLISYSADATLGEDSGYDSLKLGGATTSSLTSLIGTSRYAIQTRPSFEIGDQVPLQVDQPSAETLQISLANHEGVFADGSVVIYLFDSLLGIYHNLSTGGPYTFVQSVTADATRFRIVYQTVLSVPDNELSSKVVSYIKDSALYAQSNESIESIVIFDLTGRKVVEYTNVNAAIFQKPFHHAQGVYVAKIRLSSGVVANRKLMNQ